jgi:putative transposase
VPDAYIESFNGEFRDASLKEQLFETLAQACQEISHWRREYNVVRPHSASDRIPPGRFAAAPIGDQVVFNPGLLYRLLARQERAGLTCEVH